MEWHSVVTSFPFSRYFNPIQSLLHSPPLQNMLWRGNNNFGYNASAVCFTENVAGNYLLLKDKIDIAGLNSCDLLTDLAIACFFPLVEYFCKALPHY